MRIMMKIIWETLLIVLGRDIMSVLNLWESIGGSILDEPQLTEDPIA